MPQSYYNATGNPELTGLGLAQLSNVCPSPLTPPPDEDEQYSPLQSHAVHPIRARSAPSSNNTAAGMAQSQEDSVYLSPAATPESLQDGFSHEEKDKMEIVHDECRDGTKTPMLVSTCESTDGAGQDSLQSSPSVAGIPFAQSFRYTAPQPEHIVAEQQIPSTPSDVSLSSQQHMCVDDLLDTEEEAHSQGLAPIDLLFNRSIGTKPWTFSEKRLLPQYPSHVFQSFSRYSGTQQSDRQIYNVDVTILTVDMAQRTMTGYLLIRGLTPEHDTLQTYFTGEIIGGSSGLAETAPSFTFRTANPSWGATEKTDLTHWARFPAWRPLASHAKRDLSFDYPTDGGNWWEQENIFMRWKEHFLVPDHKTKSIAGASFEGFYYICLNQIQGKISGIYYHSKSEKYQQLELKHEGDPEVFNRGVTPCVEFR